MDEKDISFGNRLRFLRESKNLSQIEAAQLIGMGISSIQSHEYGSQPNRNTLKKYVNFYGCNKEWLQVGVGSPFGNVPLEPLPAYTGPALKPFIHPQILERERLEREGPDPIQGHMEEFFDTIKMAEAKLAAGSGCVVESESAYERYAFRKAWLRKITSCPDKMILMMVEGDSMEPGIKDGDMVMIDMSRTEMRSGRVYAIGVSDTIMIKRLELMLRDQVRVISDNKDYAPYIMDGKDLRIIGQVVWFARELVRLDNPMV